MPPKAKFTKDEIVSAAFNIVKKNGMDALTARSLAEELGSSPRPIFTVFNNMEEVQIEAVSAAKWLYAQYVKEGLKEQPAFKGVGRAYIRFASEQSKLFQLMFMSENKSVPDFNSVLYLIEDSYENIMESIENGYGLNRELSKRLCQHLWIYSHGIAVLLATKVCSFSEDEISVMLTEVFLSLLTKIKSEGKL